MRSDLPTRADITQYSSKVRTLNPEDTRFDDFEVLAEVVSDAKIVGVGESAHFVTEFGMARARISRFLIERCGFTHVALELGHCEARRLNPWIRGEGSESDLSTRAGPLTIGLYGRFLKWLRAFNASTSRTVQLLGPDLPNTLTILDDLSSLHTYLNVVDPDSLPILAEAMGYGTQIRGQSAVMSAGAWLAISEQDRNALSARLTRLLVRMQSLKTSYLERDSADRYEDAVISIESAIHTEQMLRSMSELFAGTAIPGDTSIRDLHTATILLKLCIRLQPEARILFVAHNNHIQKTRVSFSGELTAYPAGHFLYKKLGDGYRSIGLTHTDKTVPEMNFPAPNSEVGFTVDMLPLESAPSGSIEQALIESHLGRDITITNLSLNEDGTLGLSQIRSQSAYIVTPLHDAFDAVLAVPSISREMDLPF